MGASALALAGSLTLLQRAWSLSISVPPIVVNTGPQVVTWTRNATDPTTFLYQLRQLEENSDEIVQFFDSSTVHSFGQTTGQSQFIDLTKTFIGAGAVEGRYVVEVLNEEGSAAIGESNEFRVVSNSSAAASSILGSSQTTVSQQPSATNGQPGSSTSSLITSTRPSTGTTLSSTLASTSATGSTDSTTRTSSGPTSPLATSGSQSVSSTSPLSQPSSPDNTGAADATDATSTNKSTGAIVGGVIGALVVLCLILLAIYLFWRRRRGSVDRTWRGEEFDNNAGNGNRDFVSSPPPLVEPYMTMQPSPNVVSLQTRQSGKLEASLPSANEYPSESKSRSGLESPTLPSTSPSSERATERSSRSERRGSETIRLRDEVQNLRREVELMRAERDMERAPPPMYS